MRKDYGKYFSMVYFFLFLAYGAFYPYSNLYFERIGLRGTQIGIIGSISPFVVLFAQPAWGMFSDMKGESKGILNANMFICCIIAVLLSLVTEFYSIIAMMAALAIFQCALVPLLESATLHYLGSENRGYGRIRLWASTGYAVASIVMGQIIRFTSIKSIFCLYPAFMLLARMVARNLPENRLDVNKPIFAHIKKLLNNKNFMLFLTIVFSANVGVTTGEAFFAIYMDKLHGSEALIGLAWFIAAMSEIPVFFFSGPILKRLGEKHVICISLFIFLTRIAGYSVIKDPYYVLPLQVLSGLDFAPFYAASVIFVNTEVPDNLKATGQSLFAMVGGSLAGIAGNLLGGYLLDTVGIFAMFRVLALCILVAIAVAILGLRDVQY